MTCQLRPLWRYFCWFSAAQYGGGGQSSFIQASLFLNIDTFVYTPITVFISKLLLLIPLYLFYSLTVLLTLIPLFMLEFSLTTRSLVCYELFFHLLFFFCYYEENKCIDTMCWDDVDIFVRLNFNGLGFFFNFSLFHSVSSRL